MPIPPKSVQSVDSVRMVPGTRLAWCGLREWITLVYSVCAHCRPRSDEYRRRDELIRSLTIDDIRTSRDLNALVDAAGLFDRCRHGDAGLFHGPYRALTRAQLAERMIECDNRIDALRSGRADRPRPRGPRFDPSRLPDAALDRLIQHHADIGTVEVLRAERGRRLSLELEQRA